MTAADGAEGIELLARHENIDIVVVDLVMPRMSGRQVLGYVRRLDRPIPVILTSGYTEESLEDVLKSSDVRLIEKPYRQSDLAVAMEELSRAN